MLSTVLIVDDEPVSRATLQSIFDGQPYHLAFAQDGQEALTQAQTLTPDLILLDVMMPGLDGFAVCQQLRATPQLAEVPIIFLTVLDDRAALLRGLEAGADDFISKPVDRQELRARVRTITRLNRYRTLLGQRDRLRGLAARVVTAQEDERRRLSRELHDDLGQTLTVHLLNLHQLQDVLPPTPAQWGASVRALITETEALLTQIRHLAQNLRPPLLETLAPLAALEACCRTFATRAGWQLTFEAEANLPRLSDTYAITLYRLLQEALTNVFKHAQASHIWVELGVEDDHLSLTVQDNGRGFDTTAAELPGLGLRGMRERLELVGGHLLVRAAPQRGAVVMARLPLTLLAEAT